MIFNFQNNHYKLRSIKDNSGMQLSTIPLYLGFNIMLGFKIYFLFHTFYGLLMLKKMKNTIVLRMIKSSPDVLYLNYNYII